MTRRGLLAGLMGSVLAAPFVGMAKAAGVGPRWQDYTHRWTVVSDEELIAKLRLAIGHTHFTPPKRPDVNGEVLAELHRLSAIKYREIVKELRG